MRVLIVASYFGAKDLEPWLLDDLAIAFADAGDAVDVIVHDAKHARERGRNDYTDSRIQVFSVGPTRERKGRFGKIINYLAAGWGLHTDGYQHVRRLPYDLCIYTSIGTFSWGLPWRLKRLGIARRSVFVLWDFFPVHQLQIGRITHKSLHAPLRLLERLSIANADTIAVMSPANERFLRNYHPRLRARAVIVPPWALDPSPDGQHRTPQRERFTVIFGGQLTTGRGVEVLLGAARRLQDESVPVDFLIVGDGPARTGLMSIAERYELINTTFIEALPRENYRRLLESVHVGVAITVPGVTAPTFPSKIVEYCALSVPVLVCVEAASDAGTIIEKGGAGISVLAGDVAGLAAAVQVLYGEQTTGVLEVRRHNARKLFEDSFSVSRARETIRSAAL